MWKKFNQEKPNNYLSDSHLSKEDPQLCWLVYKNKYSNNLLMSYAPIPFVNGKFERYEDQDVVYWCDRNDAIKTIMDSLNVDIKSKPVFLECDGPRASIKINYKKPENLKSDMIEI